MPTRQPLKLKKNGARSRKPLPLNPLMTGPVAVAAKPVPPPVLRPAGAGLPPLNPYPDLSLAMAMLTKRLAGMRARRADDPRLPVVEKWLATLTKLHTDMQQLHKLEVLSQRLQPHG